MKFIMPLALALIASLSWAAEEAPILPSSAQVILNNVEKVIALNRAKYDDANKKILAYAEKSLKAEQDKLGKAGKLEEALAIKKILESFGGELVIKVDEKANSKGEDYSNPIGKWQVGGEAGGIIFTLTGDNKWRTASPDFGGTWRLIEGKIEFRSTMGNNQVFYVEPKKLAIWAWNYRGGTFGPVVKLPE